MFNQVRQYIQCAGTMIVQEDNIATFERPCDAREQFCPVVYYRVERPDAPPDDCVLALAHSGSNHGIGHSKRRTKTNWPETYHTLDRTVRGMQFSADRGSGLEIERRPMEIAVIGYKVSRVVHSMHKLGVCLYPFAHA